MEYIKTKKDPVVFAYVSNTITDDYAWLSDASSDEVKAWLQDQHKYTNSYFKGHGSSFNSKKESLRGSNDEISIRSLQKQHGKYIAVVDDTKHGLQVVVYHNDALDEFTLLHTATAPYTTIFSAEFSPISSELYIFAGYYMNETRISINLASYTDNTIIDRFGFGFDYHWSKDGRTIYYSKAVTIPDNPTVSTQEIYRYQIDTKEHELLYTYEHDAVYVAFEEAENGYIVAKVDINYHDCQLLLIASDGSVTELTKPQEIKYDFIGSMNDVYFFISDESAPYKCIVKVRHGESWDTRVILDKFKFYEMSASIIDDKIVVIGKVDAEDVCVIYDAEGEFTDDGHMPSLHASIRFVSKDDAAKTLYYHFESVSIPPSMIEFNPLANTWKVLKSLTEDPIAVNLLVQKEYIKLRDGAETCIYIIHSKDIQPDRESPLLMYGYGGYGFSQSLSYRDSTTHYTINDWCENGGVYVNVILRGGGEYGGSWHQNGKLNHKQNTFNDLFDCTEAIHALGISNPKLTVLGGSSNGGLLVSAAYTQRPDLYAVIIDSIGLHDMIHFISDPRGSMYQTEYGDPYDDAMFKYLKSYSPYHNVKAHVDYPAIYLHAGSLDTNVPPYHAMKFAAICQEKNPNGNPILLRILPNGHHDFGHGDEFVQTIAERQCFIESILNISLMKG